MKYVAERSLFLFFYLLNGFSIRVVFGIGWIFNKEKDLDIYYIVINIYVVAVLIYGNKKVLDNEDFIGYLLFFVVVFYINYFSNIILIYSLGNLNDVKILIFEVVYLVDLSNISFSFGKAYLNDIFFNYKNLFDFVILKYGFSIINLISYVLLSNLAV